MFRKRLFVLFAAAALTILGALFLPSLFGLPSTCSLKKAGAQENPCLAQEATIQGLKGLLIDATRVHNDYEATLAVLKNAVQSNAVPTAKPAAGLPFKDNFADNNVGWDTTTRAAGKATIKDKQLTLAVHPGSGFPLYVPGLTVGENFYMEATMLDTCACPDGLSYGLLIGDGSEAKYTEFIVRDQGNDVQLVQFYDLPKGTYLVNSSHKKLFTAGKPVRVGLEGKGNVFTLFIDDQEADAFRFNPYGRQVGLYLYTGGVGRDGTLTVTEVIVRDKR